MKVSQLLKSIARKNRTEIEDLEIEVYRWQVKWDMGNIEPKLCSKKIGELKQRIRELEDLEDDLE